MTHVQDEKANATPQNEAAAAAKHKRGLMWSLILKCQAWNKRQHTKEAPDLSGSKGKAVAKMADKDARRSEERSWKNMKGSRNDTSQRERQRRMTRETKLGAPLSDANQIRS